MPTHDAVPMDWMRLEIVIAAFHDEFGVWPTRARLARDAREEIRQYLGDESYAAFMRKLAPLADEAIGGDQAIVVADEGGHLLSYDEVGWSGWRIEGAQFLGDTPPEMTI